MWQSMKATYISSFDASNITSYSGTGYYIPKMLEDAGDEITYIDQLSKLNPKLQKVKRKIYEITGKKYLIERNPSVLKKWASYIESRLHKGTDVLLGYSSQPFSLLNTNKPTAFWTDAVIGNMIDYYAVYSNLCRESIRDANRMEKAALENVTLAVYSSEWAANAAIELYGVSKDKVKVVTYGANIDVNHTLEDIEDRAKKKSNNTCNLLFIGVEWHRKGGDVAVKVAEELNQQGLKTKLSIVGVELGNEIKSKNFIESYGFISKGTQEGKELLNKLISEAHFLILPTRADCTPIVYSEFNAHGIPVITTNEGGIPSVVRNDVNGFMFRKEDPPAVYAQKIIEFFKDSKRYMELSKSSFNEYVTRLNWNTAMNNFRKLLTDII